MVDFAQARRIMVDSQLRTFDVNDIPLLDAMNTVPRERFVAAGREGLAYMDQDMPVSDGPERRRMLSPMVAARLMQALEVGRGTRALDVACGLGYTTAVLAELGADATGLEESADLAAAAQARLAEIGVRARVVHERLEQGYAQAAPYDAILVNGAIEVRPEGLLRQLAEGGRLVCVQGRGRSARATLYVRSGDAFGQRSLFDAAAPPLAGFQAEPGFVF